MAGTGAQARAHDATVQVTGLPDPPTSKQKAEAAVAYFERELAVVRTAVGNAEAKVGKIRGHLAEAEAELAAARGEVPAAETRLATARRQLAQMGG